MRFLSRCLLILSLICSTSLQSFGGDSVRRVAILPALTDFEAQSEWRRALSGFDARLQAELLKGWQTEVLSRAGLSVVVFEQKLRAATDPAAPLHRVLPADIVLVSVFDLVRHELRLHVAPVGSAMKVGNPVILKAKSPRDLADALPGEAAKVLANAAHLTALESTNPDAKANNASGKERLVCALLEAISPEGMQDATAVALSPFIRAGLEQAVASGQGGAVQLVERNEVAKLVEEKALQAAFGAGLEANAAAQLGRMVKANLILIPFVHTANAKKTETDLFALEVATGRLLECVSWSSAPGEAPPADKMNTFLAKASAKARALAKQSTPDDAAARHAEAAFLASLPQQWAGLRMRIPTMSQVATRLADAALALAADDPELMENAVTSLLFHALPAALHQQAATFLPHDEWTEEWSRLQKSGQSTALQSAARRVFELPLQELQRTQTPHRIALLATMWNNLGEHQKALQTVTAGGTQEGGLIDTKAHSTEAARAYMGLGRYKECTETVLRQGRFSNYAMMLMVDAFRAGGDEQNEFKYAWINRKNLGYSYDRHARLLDLAVKFGKAPEALELYASNSCDWPRAESYVQLAAIRVRLSLGQKDIAASDAQCALINARARKQAPEIKEIEKILASLGQKPLDHLLRAGDFVKLPADCVFHLIHDQTIDAAHARAVAENIAGFWGCPVQIWPVKLDARKLSCYRSLGQTLDSSRLLRVLTEANPPAQRYLGRVFLTREKFVNILANGTTGDTYGWSVAQFAVLSDHYFQKYAQADKRPLALIDAIPACDVPLVNMAIKRHLNSDKDIANDFAPIAPDLFSNNGTLIMNRHELGISPRTAAVLRDLTWDQIAAELGKGYDVKNVPFDPKDQPIIQDLSRQFQNLKPETVTPPTAPKSGN